MYNAYICYVYYVYILTYIMYNTYNNAMLLLIILYNCKRIPSMDMANYLVISFCCFINYTIINNTLYYYV